MIAQIRSSEVELRTSGYWFLHFGYRVVIAPRPTPRGRGGGPATRASRNYPDCRYATTENYHLFDSIELERPTGKRAIYPVRDRIYQQTNRCALRIPSPPGPARRHRSSHGTSLLIITFSADFSRLVQGILKERSAVLASGVTLTCPAFCVQYNTISISTRSHPARRTERSGRALSLTIYKPRFDLDKIV